MTLAIATKPKIAIICVDSQAAIKAVGISRNKSGQHIVQRIVLVIDRLKQKGSTVKIHWVPAYIDFCGNKAVDKSAKKATGWRVKKLRACSAGTFYLCW